jgi:chromosome segregation ATPase
MRDGMPAFLESLNSVQLDRFVRVMGSLESRASEREMARLQEELKGVKDALNKVNRERDEIRIQKEEFESIIDDLDSTPNNRGHHDLVQLRYMLCNRVSDLNDKIAAARPDELHEEKAKLKKDIANRRLLAALAGMLRNTAANEHGS